jgi:Tfp pilus assembly protein PilP
MSRKMINLGLVTVACSVWLLVFYKIITAEGRGSVAESREIRYRVKTTSIDSTDQYPAHLQKDPFTTPFNCTVMQKQIVSPRSPRPEQPKFPDLNLIGIIYDSKKPMAVIGLADNSVHFIRAKQKLDDLEILQIEKTKVVIRYGKEVNSYYLE